jgi:PAS domain S-box-containing protein
MHGTVTNLHRGRRIARDGSRLLKLILLCVPVMLLLAMQDATPTAPLTLTDAQLAWLDAHPILRLGPYRNYAPAQFVDDEGVHRGIAADYVEIVEAKLGRRFTNVYTETWQELLDRTEAREIDLIAMAADTPDRRAYLSFTAPYLELPAVIIARDNVEGRLSPDDLENQRVCVVGGYAVVEYLVEQFPALTLELVPDTKTGLRKVSLGQSDAFISDLAVASYFIEQEAITNLRIVGESGFVYRMGFAIRNDWPELTAMIDQALQEVTTAQARTIFNRWISLSHETEFASRRLLQTLISVAAAIALLAVGILFWNRTLHGRVRQKTRELKEELTERRRVADDLSVSEARIRLIINAALDAVITMDGAGVVTGWSRQAESMFGFSRDEVLGRSLADLIIPSQYRDAHNAGLQHYHETGEGPVLSKRIEISARHCEGHEFPIELAITPIPKPEGVEFSAFVRDITDRQKIETELRMHREQLEDLVIMRTAEMRSAKELAEHAESQLALRVTDLEQALAEVNQLRGLLPICSYCKRIREGEDYSKSVEAYLSEHRDVQFSHGICPDCYKKHVEPDLKKL